MIGSPYSKQEIKKAFIAESDLVFSHFSSHPIEAFFAAPEGVWSPADNLVHLIKSTSPVVMALGLPKMALRLRFGKFKGNSDPLAAVRARYMDAHKKGLAVASGGYLPEVEEKTTDSRTKILAKWTSKNQELISSLDNWSEKQLDTYSLPHPIIGKMSVREILFFTLYHNMHHVNDVARFLDKPEVEWFT